MLPSHVVTAEKTTIVSANRFLEQPFYSTSADIFSCHGWEFFVYNNWKTGWPCFTKLGRSSSSKYVIQALQRWFFLTLVFQHPSAPMMALSLYLASLKSFVTDGKSNTSHLRHTTLRVTGTRKQLLTVNGDLKVDEFQRGLIEWRTTPSPCARSLAQQLFGRPLSSFLVTHHRSFAQEWKIAADAADAACTQLDDRRREHYNLSVRDLSSLSIKSHVDLQDPCSKLWSTKGVVFGIGHHRKLLCQGTKRAHLLEKLSLSSAICAWCTTNATSNRSRRRSYSAKCC